MAWLATRKQLEREIDLLRTRLYQAELEPFYRQRDLDEAEAKVSALEAEVVELREKVSTLRDLLWSAELELTALKRGEG